MLLGPIFTRKWVLVFYFNKSKMKYTYLFIIALLCSCNPEQKNLISEVQSKDSNSEPLFTVLSPETTGIHFFNELKENTYMNGLLYEYYYNGGGVAVADFNKD